MKNLLVKKLKGFHKAPRARFLLLSEHRLSQEEFVLYELGIALAVWDQKKENYGTFKASNQELADILGWDSDTSALRHKRSLIKKGYFELVDEGGIRPVGFEKFQIRKHQPANNQEESSETQSSSANIEESGANMQEGQPQNIKFPLVSSRDNLVSEHLSDEELEKILTDIDTEEIR